MYMYMFVYVVLEVERQINSIQECRMFSKILWRMQRTVGLPNFSIWTSYEIFVQVVPLEANYGIIAISQTFDPV